MHGAKKVKFNTLFEGAHFYCGPILWQSCILQLSLCLWLLYLHNFQRLTV